MTQENRSEKKIVRLLRMGDVAGLEAIIGEKYHHNAIVIEPCDICRIPVEVVKKLQKTSPVICNELMTRWSKASISADQWLTHLHKGQSRQRVISLIECLIENSKTKPEFTLPSREDISSILSLTKETVSRIIADLKRDEKLHDLGHGCYEAYLK